MVLDQCNSDTVTSRCTVIARVSLTWVMFRMWFVHCNWLVVCYLLSR